MVDHKVLLSTVTHCHLSLTMPTRGMALWMHARVLPPWRLPGQDTNMTRQSHVKTSTVHTKGAVFHQRHLWSPRLVSLYLQEFFSICPISFRPLSLGNGPVPLRAITDSFCASSELTWCKISSMFCSAFRISSCLVSALFLLGNRAWQAHPLVLQTCSHTLRPWGEHSSATHCNFCYQHEATLTLWIRDD